MKGLLLFLAVLLVGCDSLNANHDTTDLEAKMDTLQERVNGIDIALDEVERNQGPRIKALDKSNARIGQFNDIKWDGPGCTGNGFLLLPASVGQQGFVFMPRLESDNTGLESPYMMVAPNSAAVGFSWVSEGFGASCQELTSVRNGFVGFPMVPNDEAVCAVPDLGIPAQMWPNGTVNAAMVEVYTASSCLTLVPASVLPKVLVGS